MYYLFEKVEESSWWIHTLALPGFGSGSGLKILGYAMHGRGVGTYSFWYPVVLVKLLLREYLDYVTVGLISLNGAYVPALIILPVFFVPFPDLIT